MILNKDRLIQLVRGLALETKKEGEPPFILKSGKTSRYYLDCRKLTLHDEGLYTVVEFIWNYLRTLNISSPYIDAIGGPCVGADPIVGGLLYRSGSFSGYGNTRGFLVRSQEKDHGKSGRLIGSIEPDDNCLFIEDVVTTGGTSLDAIKVVQAYGGKVKLAICVVDRLEGAQAAFASIGVPLHSLLTINDILPE